MAAYDRAALSAEAESDAVRISVVIVTHDHRDAVRKTLPELTAQLREEDELILVDNASSDDTIAAVRQAAPDATVVELGSNVGFGAGCNCGAEAATGDLLLFLNPDAVPTSGFREAIERPLNEGRGWAAWQGVVTAEGGTIINSRGGVVHFTGIAWAGGAGDPVIGSGGAGVPTGEASTRPGAQGETTPVGAEEADTGGTPAPPPPKEPGFVSGACLAIPRDGFEEVGGFAESFFLYHEDVDLSLRLRLGGGRLGVEPDAVVEHDYEFAKAAKWRQLERNRWATLMRTYPGALLALIAPALLVTELALLPISIAGGWSRQKLAAWRDVLAALPRLRRERRAIQATRTITAGEFARALSPDLASPYLGGAGRSRLLRWGLRAYWLLVVASLGGSRSARAGGVDGSGSRSAG
jgi:GT2 family glycosyltransferase